ncbi:hypothetical protein [Sorangium sp. So ce1389]|uniref:hypothetical protein n=1 Tax=Sorangium sp. So ce1389 TaxID=3133336 RepID=UPI003F5F6944
MTQARHVRRVHLRAPSDELVRRGALLLEDALRTAALPGADAGRSYVVRRLDVGAIDPHESPSALSARIEQRFRALCAAAVPAASPRAASAPAVYFADPVEPLVLLAEHAARGAGEPPWFVRLAVPRRRPDHGPRESLRAALATAAFDLAPPAVIALVEALLARGALAPLLSALEPRDGPLLLRALGVSEPASLAPVPVAPRAGPLDLPEDLPRAWQPPDAALDGPAGALAPGFQLAFRAWAPRWGPADARSVWLAALGLLARSAARFTDPQLALRAQRLAGWAAGGPGAGAARARPELAGSSPGLGAPRPSDAADFPEASAAFQESSAVFPEAPAAFQRSSADFPEAPAASQRSSADFPEAPAASQRSSADFQEASAAFQESSANFQEASAGAPSHVAAGELAGEAGVAEPPEAPPPWTSFGGLLFLVPVLERLGVPAFLEQHPALADAGFPLHLLAHVAAHLGAPSDDPLLLALGEPPCRLPDVAAALPAAALDLLAPAALPPAAALSPAAALPPMRGADLLAVFRRAARRYSRRVASMGLRTLVARPARVVSSRTHIDLVLDIQRVDLRIRRTGLDLDPGFVPWLGRVLHFHYRHGEESWA